MPRKKKITNNCLNVKLVNSGGWAAPHLKYWLFFVIEALLRTGREPCCCACEQ